MNSDAFGVAYRDGVKRTVAFLRKVGVPLDLADDAAQTGWLRGWEKIDQLRDDSMIVPWVNTIALNHCRRTMRNLSREQTWKPSYENAVAVFVNCAAIDIAYLLEASKPSDRRLLEASLSGATNKEMARAEGVTPTAMRLRLHRARRKARELCETHSYPAQRSVSAC